MVISESFGQVGVEAGFPAGGVMSIGLSRQEVEKLLRHLNEKWASKTCPMCRQNDWSVTGAVWRVRKCQTALRGSAVFEEGVS